LLREHSIQYTIHSLTKETYLELKEIMFDAQSKVQMILDRDPRRDKDTKRHPYLLFKTLLPMIDILEYLPSIPDSE